MIKEIFKLLCLLVLDIVFINIVIALLSISIPIANIIGILIITAIFWITSNVLVNLIKN